MDVSHNAVFIFNITSFQNIDNTVRDIMAYRTCKAFLIVRKQFSCYLRGNAVLYVAVVFLSKQAQEMSDRFCGEEKKGGGGWDGRKGEEENKQIYSCFCKKLPNLRRKRTVTNTAIRQHITTFLE